MIALFYTKQRNSISLGNSIDGVFILTRLQRQCQKQNTAGVYMLGFPVRGDKSKNIEKQNSFIDPDKEKNRKV